MTDSVRKPRRWPWIVGVFVALLAGCSGGVVLTTFTAVYYFRAPCPPIYEPMPGEVVFRRGPDMVLPRPLNRPRDERVPTAGRMVGINATVELLHYVERDGRVSRVVLARSSGFCPYDVQALRQARDIRFRAGQWRGEAVAGWVSLRITYQGGPRTQRMLPREKPGSASAEI